MKKTKLRSKSEEKRQGILAAAIEIFCAKGFTKASMDSIAKAADVSKQTVYSHFGNKDELFVASISQRCNEFRISALPKDVLLEPKVALLTFAESFIQLLLSDEGMAIHRVCISESQSNPKVSQLFYAAGPEQVIKQIAQLLASYNEQGLLKINDTQLAAIQFLSLIKGEAAMRREYNTELQINANDIESYLKSSVELYLRGYGYQAKS